MQSFDPGALARALGRIPVPHDAEPTWKLDVDGFELFAQFCDEVRRAPGRSPRHEAALVTDNRAELDEMLDHHKIAPYFGKNEPGTGIITTHVGGLVKVDLPLERVLVKGGDALRRAEPTSVFNSLLVASTEDPRVLVTQYDSQAVARLPLTDGKLWLVQSASGRDQDDLHMFGTVRQVMGYVRDLHNHYDVETLSKQSQRRSHVLWPLFGVRDKLEIDWLAGARRGGQRVSGAFQILRVDFDTRDVKTARAPFADPDEPQPLAFNGTTLVFKTGVQGHLEWAAKVSASDWEVRDK